MNYLRARPYRDSMDLNLMRELLIAGRQSGMADCYLHPGYLDWAMYYLPDEAANPLNVRLWERADGGQPALAAWAMLLRHQDTFDLFVHPALVGGPEHERIVDEYIAWAEARAGEAGINQLRPFWLVEHDQVLIGLMRARGFEVLAADPAPPLFERRLTALPDVQLPDGYRVQGVSGLEDARLRAEVTYAAFHPHTSWDDYSSGYVGFFRSSIYKGAHDLFVRAPDGRGAAACTIWLDPHSAVGLFEPVGTHPDFQRRGLGKAVMAEGLRRMQAAGMQSAIVGFHPNNTGARALYSSLGFRASLYFVEAQKLDFVHS